LGFSGCLVVVVDEEHRVVDQADVGGQEAFLRLTVCPRTTCLALLARGRHTLEDRSMASVLSVKSSNNAECSSSAVAQHILGHFWVKRSLKNVF
jgi:hypothetical protein